MSKKDLAAVTSNLAALATQMPTQMPQPCPIVEPAAPPVAKPEKQIPARLKTDVTAKPAPANQEETTQFSFGLRKTLRKELSRLADDNEMTMRAFVLNALKDKGLSVRPEDLLDYRKERG